MGIGLFLLRSPLIFFGILFFGTVSAFVSAEPEVEENSAKAIVQKYPERTERLFQQINLEFDGLESVKRSRLEGDSATALRALLLYMREKSVPEQLKPDLPPPRGDILGLADDATQDMFTIQSRTYSQPKNVDGTIDWEDKGPNKDKEWAWMLNRHPHFEFLVTAFQSTRNPRYLETISRHLIDWIPRHPPPDHLTFSSSWRALEAARRMIDSWLAVYTYERSEDALSDEALFLLLSAVPEHADYLRNHYSFWGGNHKMTEKMAIAVCALAWPEFSESRDWLEGAMEVISEELFRQTYSDGSYKELANHYQKVVAQNYLRILKMLDGNSLVEVNPLFRERVEALWTYFAYVSRPSGFGPLNSDSSREDNFTYLVDANLYFERLDWQYILNHGASGAKPEHPPTRYFPYAGHAIMRDGWGNNAHWAFFDIGPHGSAHQHWDRLHLSISIGEQDLLVDSGRYIYKPGPIREYFRYGLGHNVVRVDETDSRRPPNKVSEPMETLSQIEPDFDAFAATVRFNLGNPKSEQIRQQRLVVYVRGNGWLIVDELVGYGAHLYDTMWNFHPDCLVTRVDEGLAIELTNGQETTLTLLNQKQKGSWDLARGQLDPEIRGWYSWAYNERRASTSARYRYPESQPHINVWWVAPAASGSKARQIGDLRSLKDLDIELVDDSGSKQSIQWDENEKKIILNR